MRRSLTKLAAVKPSRFLESGAPTGLTGLFTHPAPRSTLLYLYSSTLEKLSTIPESSLYRQSAEAITKHRMAIIESVKPEGFDEWNAKAQKLVAEHPDVFETKEGGVAHDGGRHVKETKNGRTFITSQTDKEYDDQTVEWDGEKDSGGELEGARSTEERRGQAALHMRERPGTDTKTVAWEPEPPLSAEQIGELETKIGAGLIEEVIQVAEGELKLVDVMIKSQVWEDLEEKPVEGQWTYFMRDSGTPVTQAPPQAQK